VSDTFLFVLEVLGWGFLLFLVVGIFGR